MEEEFVVKSSGEGSLPMTKEIDAVLSTMGCQGFNDRAVGSVKVVVEKEGGKITKQRLVWGEDNDPAFNAAQQRSADLLLATAVKAVEGGGDPSDLIIKFVVKK
jgi:hypothetical protein